MLCNIYLGESCSILKGIESNHVVIAGNERVLA